MKLPKTPITRIIPRPAGKCRVKWWAYGALPGDPREVVLSGAPTKFQALRWAVKHYRRVAAMAVAHALV